MLIHCCPVSSTSSSLDQVELRGLLSHWEQHQLLLVLIMASPSSMLSFSRRIWDSYTCVFMCRSQVNFCYELCVSMRCFPQIYVVCEKGHFPGRVELLSSEFRILGKCSFHGFLVWPCPQSVWTSGSACLYTGFLHEDHLVRLLSFVYDCGSHKRGSKFLTSSVFLASLLPQRQSGPETGAS